jgi:hypothetical protein
MFLFAYDLETCLFVDVARRMQNALRPQRHFPITRLSGELDALLYQPLPDTESTRFRFDV